MFDPTFQPEAVLVGHIAAQVAQQQPGVMEAIEGVLKMGILIGLAAPDVARTTLMQLAEAMGRDMSAGVIEDDVHPTVREMRDTPETYVDRMIQEQGNFLHLELRKLKAPWN